MTSVGGGRRSAGSSVSTYRRWSWVLIVVLPAVVQSVTSLLSSSSGPIDCSHISRSVLASQVHCPVQRHPQRHPRISRQHHQRHPRLQWADGNVTLARQSSVGVTEEAPQAMCPHQHSPGIEPRGVLYPRPARRGTARGRTSSRMATHDGSRSHIAPGIERGAQAGIEPATAAWMTQQVGSSGAGQIMSTQLHHPDDSVPFARRETRLRRAVETARRAVDS